MQPAKLGPEWTEVLAFNGYAPSYPPGHAVWRWSSAFRSDGGTLRVVGSVASDKPGSVGLSLGLEGQQSGGWVDLNGNSIVPHDTEPPSGTTMSVDWATTGPVEPGEYRLGINGTGTAIKYALGVYVTK